MFSSSQHTPRNCHIIIDNCFFKCTKRFAARRGLVQSIISNNATQFVASAKVIKEKLIEEFRTISEYDLTQAYLK